MIDRTLAPEIKPINHIPFWEPEKEILENKVELFSIRESTDSAVRIDFVFDGGSLKTSKIIAQITGKLLLSGTAEISSDEIEDSIDLLGGYTHVSVSTEKTTLSIFGLKEHITDITKIVVNAVINVTFDKKEVKQLLQEQKNRFKIQLQKVSVQARRAFIGELFKNSPYGDLVQSEDFKNINQKDLIEFHRDSYVFGLEHISVVGALDDDQMEVIKNLGNKFGKKKEKEVNYNLDYQPTTLHIEKEKAIQTAIRIGRVLFNKTHPDFKKMIVLNTVFGGYFGSRLMTSIREEKGYTYGIGSGVSQYLKTGYFFISTEVAKEYKDATIDAIKEEIIRLQEEEVSAKELSLVKSYIIGELLEQSDGANAMMSCFLSVRNYGLGFSYYDELIKTVHEITPKELKSLAQKYLNWDDFIVVTAG